MRINASAAALVFRHTVGWILLTGFLGCGTVKTDSAKVTAVDAHAPVKKFNFRPSQKSPEASSGDLMAKFPYFNDVAAKSGINHVYDNGASPKALMVESTGGGCGWFDFDLDDRLDLYLTQGGQPDAPDPNSRPPDALFRQLDDGKFVQVSELARVGDRGYGQGVAIADMDNDGFDDLFVSNVGRSALYRNCGDGTFTLVTAALEGKRSVWSSSAAWGDIDRDGDLDLYVCNYTIYDPYHPVPCRDKNGIPSICHPRNVEPEPDEFFLNLGDGTFEESSQRLGLFGPGNKALGVVIADLNDDDWPDIYVANDTTANFLFINENGQHFKESSLVLGGAVSATGEPQASMGVAFGDYDDNGLPDLCLTHFTGEWNTLYQNLGPQGLQDVSAITGLREPTLPKLGFGTVMTDFNFDGHMDLFFANGHIDPRFTDSEGYEMTSQIFSFDGRRWREGSNVGGDFFKQKAVARGVATGDFDRDGDLDLVVARQNSPVAVLRNDSECGHGLMVAVAGRKSNRNGLNAKLIVTCGKKRLVGELAGGTSYAASHERLVCFGLGSIEGPCQVEVRWPSGTVDHVEVPARQKRIEIVEGHGIMNRGLPAE